MIWNTTVKMLMNKYYNEYGRTINTFEAIAYREARYGRNVKIKEMQVIPCVKRVLYRTCYNEFKMKKNQNIGKQNQKNKVIFAKTAQGEPEKCIQNQLVANNINSNLYPKILPYKFMKKRGNIKSNRVLLTTNPYLDSSGQRF